MSHMAISRRSLQTLQDLVENKLSSLIVYDREDARELAILEQARRELIALAGPVPARRAAVPPLPTERMAIAAA